MEGNLRSESIAQLAAALSLAQGEMKGAAKDSENPHFKSMYADLASIWDACRDPLAKNGLAVIQLPSADGSRVTVTTILAHKSGEWIASELTLKAAGDTAQPICGTITYGRRYGLAAVVGIAPDDDDGEAAEGRGAPQPPPRTEVRRSAMPLPTKITDGEQKQIFALMEQSGKTPDAVKAIIERHGFKRTADITKDKFGAICADVKGQQV